MIVGWVRGGINKMIIIQTGIKVGTMRLSFGMRVSLMHLIAAAAVAVIVTLMLMTRFTRGIKNCITHTIVFLIVIRSTYHFPSKPARIHHTKLIAMITIIVIITILIIIIITAAAIISTVTAVIITTVIIIPTIINLKVMATI